MMHQCWYFQRVVKVQCLIQCSTNIAGETIQRTEGVRPSAAIPIVAPPQQTPGTTTKSVADQTAALTLESGLGYPGVHSSTVDVNGNPVYAPLGKAITDVEIDVDLIEHEKPWRRPGADQSDWFNYGFDEFTWSTYCLRQKTVADAIVEQKEENTKFEMRFGGGGGGGGMMPGMPAAAKPRAANPMAAMAGGMPGMGGMPDQQEFQVAMMEAMRQQGVSDPSKVDFNAFMAQLQGGGGMMGQANIPAGPSGGQQNFDQGNWQGGGGGGGGNYQQGGRGGYGRGKRGQRY
jgi:pre-mRNA 3'-end-processing factor FIP1